MSTLQFKGGLGEQLTGAAEIAIETYAEQASLLHQGYAEDDIDEFLLKDLEAEIDRPAIAGALTAFRRVMPDDVGEVSDKELRAALIEVLKKRRQPR